jgi:hypothetical protein
VDRIGFLRRFFRFFGFFGTVGLSFGFGFGTRSLGGGVKTRGGFATSSATRGIGKSHMLISGSIIISSRSSSGGRGSGMKV